MNNEKGMTYLLRISIKSSAFEERINFIKSIFNQGEYPADMNPLLKEPEKDDAFSEEVMLYSWNSPKPLDDETERKLVSEGCHPYSGKKAAVPLFKSMLLEAENEHNVSVRQLGEFYIELLPEVYNNPLTYLDFELNRLWESAIQSVTEKEPEKRKEFLEDAKTRLEEIIKIDKNGLLNE